MRICVLLLCVAACSGEEGNSDGAPPDGGGSDAAPYGACAPLAPGEPPRDRGAGCGADTDCMAGFCVGGWCSRTCTSDNECRPHGSIGTPTPFAQSTQMKCLAEPNIGVQGYCWPGSGDPCDGTAGSCGSGETC